MEKMSIRALNDENRLMKWAALVKECRDSGISVTDWCKKKGIKTNQFYKWQRKVFDALMAQQEAQLQEVPSSTAAVQFAELPPPTGEPSYPQLSPAPSTPVQISKAIIATLRIGGTEIDIYDGADATVVEALCRVVSHAQ